MLDGWPKRKVRHRLMELAADGAAWSRMAAELRGFLSDAHHYNTAIDVLSYMRDRLRCMASAADKTKVCENFVRTLNKKGNAAKRVVAVTRPIAAPRRGDVDGWRSAPDAQDRRRDSSRGAVTQAALTSWGIAGLPGALAPQRSRRRMARECARVPGRTPQQFAPTLLHTSALPTLTANTSDQWVWADGRHFSVEETARACGVADGSPLHRGLRAGGGLTVRQATRALGEGVHVHVAKHVVGLALQDLLPRAEGSPFTYASAFSGLDGIAAALHEHLAGSPMHYAFAAERDDRLRGVLCHTWAGEGLVSECAFKNARQLPHLRLPRVALFSCTPSCKPFSESNPRWTHRERAAVLADLHSALHYVRTHKPDRVILENLTAEDAVIGIDTMVGQLSDYEFERHDLCPFRDFGIPTRRRRSYWVGKLKARA